MQPKHIDARCRWGLDAGCTPISGADEGRGRTASRRIEKKITVAPPVAEQGGGGGGEEEEAVAIIRHLFAIKPRRWRVTYPSLSGVDCARLVRD